MNSKITYRQQFTRCGKERCHKCKEGPGHGPYWYAYWSVNGRTVSKYIGIHLPENVEMKTVERDMPVLSTRSAHGSIRQQTPAEPSLAVNLEDVPALRIYLLGQFRIRAQKWQ